MYELRRARQLPEVVRYSADEFHRAGFTLGADPPLGSISSATLEAAIVDGFTEALVMPAAAWQHEHVGDLADAFGARDGWNAPHLDVTGLVPLRRPTGPYLLLLHHDPRSDDDLRGLTAPALRRVLGDHACLTVPEYLVVQRMMFDRHGDHRFDEYTGDPPGWMWLADSSDGTRTAMAYWYGAKRRIEVTACATGSKNPRKGARRCRVLPFDGDERTVSRPQ